MKFKVGDKVRLVRMEDEWDCYEKYLGKIFTIKKIYKEFAKLEEETEENIAPYLKNLELVKEYTYEDLKKSPIGTKITFENKIVLIKLNKGYYRENREAGILRNSYDLRNLKDNFGNCGKIIKIEEPEYKTVYESKKEILDEAEKRYLRGVIRPFRDKLEHIIKMRRYNDMEEFIGIKIKNDCYISFPYFKKNTMYKGMEVDKKYTLEELGL